MVLANLQIRARQAVDPCSCSPFTSLDDKHWVGSQSFAFRQVLCIQRRTSSWDTALEPRMFGEGSFDEILGFSVLDRFTLNSLQRNVARLESSNFTLE